MHAESVEDGREVTLSVVLITENEDDRIATCIESVVAACRRAVSRFEVILVDSASTDRTIERAREYPITILRIPAEHTVSCGAGRYAGEQIASGEMILHVDGDMELTDSWLPRAVAYLRDNDDVSAVEGCLNEVTTETVSDVDSVGGVMLYDAEALRSVGGFDPYLRGNEDIEVGYKLTTAGHRLVCLPERSANHPVEDGTFTEPLRRWRLGYYSGPGEAIRKSLSSPPVLRKFLRRQRYKFALLAWFSLGAVSLAGGLVGGWLALSAVGFALVAAKRGPDGAVTFVVAKTLGLVGLFVGFLGRPRPPDSYPIEAVEVVQTGPVHEGRVMRADT